MEKNRILKVEPEITSHFSSILNCILKNLICFPIKLYQYLISPLLKPSCRYYPSCSHYAESAIKQCGIIKGLWMALKRVLRCHPWSRGGYDPVLPNNENF